MLVLSVDAGTHALKLRVFEVGGARTVRAWWWEIHHQRHKAKD